MSDRFEHQLDLALDTRRQRRQQKEAERTEAERARQAAHADLERMQARFCTEMRGLIEQAVGRANRHFAKRAENCQLCEVSGYFTGPLHPGGSACNPIAFELRANDREVGEVLVIQLTHGGMIEAFLGPLRPCEPQAHTTRLSLGWRPIRLDRFNAETAFELILRYVTAVTAQWPLGRESAKAGFSATP